MPPLNGSSMMGRRRGNEGKPVGLISGGSVAALMGALPGLAGVPVFDLAYSAADDTIYGLVENTSGNVNTEVIQRYTAAGLPAPAGPPASVLYSPGVPVVFGAPSAVTRERSRPAR